MYGPLKAGGNGSKGLEARIEEIAVRHAAIFQNSELQRHHPFVAQLHRRRHHRKPIALHALIHTGKVIVEIDAFGRREHFNAGTDAASPSTSRRGTSGYLSTADRTRRIHLRGIADGI